MNKPAQKGLRDLSHKILKLTREHPAYSQAWPHVVILTDHLCAMAAIEELNRRLTEANAKLHAAEQK
jgi:hypothetical protein